MRGDDNASIHVHVTHETRVRGGTRATQVERGGIESILTEYKAIRVCLRRIPGLSLNDAEILNATESKF